MGIDVAWRWAVLILEEIRSLLIDRLVKDILEGIFCHHFSDHVLQHISYQFGTQHTWRIRLCIYGSTTSDGFSCLQHLCESGVLLGQTIQFGCCWAKHEK